MCNCLLNLLCPCRTNYLPSQHTCGYNTPTFPINNGCGCQRRQNECGCYNTNANAALINAYGESTVEFGTMPTTVPYVYQYNGAGYGDNYQERRCNCGCGCRRTQTYSNLSTFNDLR